MQDREIRALENELASKLGVGMSAVCLVGSTLICGKGNDQDFLCLVPDHSVVENAGFVSDVEVQYESALHSFRKDGVNIIAVTNLEFFSAEVAIAIAAREVARRPWDMSNRGDRVAFHGAIREVVLNRLANLPKKGVF